ncbi:RAD protein (Pv-fam-e) [Plasmodium vivax North Korean]|uniref:RAD protein (Pv-fam-e) n=1 Tax=Plasmodium vivax North Korean TaxID=1035514 RepID=A0A0J9WER3_PLAVI|nr:RAD protein (Pv-fam-e) [Plasmodium vivax North Korean]
MLQVNYFWRVNVSKVISLFFLPLWIALLKTNFVLYERATLKAGVGAPPRELSTLSEIVQHYYPEAKLKGGSKANKREVAAIVQEMKSLEKSRSTLKRKVSGKKIIMHSFNLYTQFLTKIRKKMMNNLSDQLSQLASQNRMPEKDKKKLWEECQTAIDKEFEYVKNSYAMVGDIYAKAKVILGIGYSDVLSRYLKVWKSVLYSSEKKWSEALVERTKKAYPCQLNILNKDRIKYLHRNAAITPRQHAGQFTKSKLAVLLRRLLSIWENVKSSTNEQLLCGIVTSLCSPFVETNYIKRGVNIFARGEKVFSQPHHLHSL